MLCPQNSFRYLAAINQKRKDSSIKHGAMKEKILQLLRAKFNGTPNVVIDRVADHLSQTVQDENQLETAIAGVKTLVKSFSEVLQSETDRRVTDAQKKAVDTFRQKHGLDENGKPVQNPNPPAGGQGGEPGGGKEKEVPEWAKQLQETVTKLSGTVESVNKQTSQTTKLSEAKGKLRSKGVLEKHVDDFAGRINLDAEDMDAEVERVSKEYTTFRQDFINKEVEDGNYSPVAGSESEDEMVKNIDNWGKKFETKTN
jgi:hypothetical protein